MKDPETIFWLLFLSVRRRLGDILDALVFSDWLVLYLMARNIDRLVDRLSNGRIYLDTVNTGINPGRYKVSLLFIPV